MFDITKLTASDEAFFQFKNADDEPIFADKAKKEPVGVVLYGPASSQAIAIEADIGNRNIGRAFKGKAKSGITTDTMRAENIERLVARTKEFRNLTYPPAADAKGADLFEAIWSDRKLPLYDQGVAWIGEWAGFLPK